MQTKQPDTSKPSTSPLLTPSLSTGTSQEHPAIAPPQIGDVPEKTSGDSHSVKSADESGENNGLRNRLKAAIRKSAL